ncbi:MAG: hypothetical protein HXY22_06145 [Alphaproteobacteria bacterium]|nr:hypothetical protein [Alphaproteobacteria bacterium]
MKSPLASAALMCCGIVLTGCESVGFALAVADYERTLDTYSQTDTTATAVTTKRHADVARRR